MTYGLKFLNNNNETIVDEQNVKPWFVGQGQNTSNFDDSDRWTEIVSSNAWNPGSGNWRVYRLNYAVPADASNTSIVVMTLPDTGKNIWYFPADNSFMSSIGTAGFYAVISDQYALDASTDIPKVYYYSTETIPSNKLSTGYGLQLFDANAQCVFDAKKVHFNPYSFSDIALPNPTGTSAPYPITSTTLSSVPSTAGFALPVLVCKQYTEVAGSKYINTYTGMYKRVGNTVYTVAPLTKKETAYNTLPQAYWNTGTTGSQPLIVVDTARLDQGYTQADFPTTYQLSVNYSELREGGGFSGEDFVVTLQTTNVPNGTYVPFTLSGTGYTTGDLSEVPITYTNYGNYAPVTGQISVYGGTGFKRFHPELDGVKEGPELVTLSLVNGKASVSFTIKDTETYVLSANSVTNVNEGQNIQVTLTTSQVANGTQVPYTISGITSADLNPTISGNSLTGYFTVVANNSLDSTVSKTFTLANDQLLEGPETFTLTLNNGKGSVSVLVNDTSTPVYTITPSISSHFSGATNADEGNAITYAITGEYVPNGTIIYWRNEGTTTAADFLQNATSGSLTFTNNATSLELNVKNDNLTEPGALETVIVKLYTRSDFTNLVATAVTISVSDTSVTVPTYSLSQNTYAVNEGGTVTYNVTTTNVANGTALYWKSDTGGGYCGPADFTDGTTSGSVTINNGIGTFTRTLTNDSKTEGTETFAIALYSNGTYQNLVALSNNVSVYDTSTAPVYSPYVNINPSSFYEGGYTTFSVGGGPPYSTFYYSVDSASYNNSGTLSASGTASGTVTGAVGSHTVYFLFADGNTSTASFTVTLFVGPPAPTVYNEYVSISPSTMRVGSTFNLTIGGGKPNDTFTFHIDNGGTAGPISLNSSGSFTNPSAGGFGIGTYTFYADFAQTGHSASASFTVTA